MSLYPVFSNKFQRAHISLKPIEIPTIERTLLIQSRVCIRVVRRCFTACCRGVKSPQGYQADKSILSSRQ